ncbi:MAG TPA: arginine deiminase-related protein [Saprospiraceae bacterium]|nr:arginine deiminase-related protein [Saprospiraceae bacterium]
MESYIFVGKSDRTNDAGYKFLKQTFPNKKVVQIPLFVSDDYQTNVLHLDCAFQPVGDEYAIFYPKGFLVRPDALLDCFKENNLIQVNQQQMIDMYPNIFSISKSKVVIEKSFIELKTQLLQKGFEVIEVNYGEISKMGGLLRCSTLPLKRKY